MFILIRRAIVTCCAVSLTAVPTASFGQAEEALFIVRGTRYTYGLFGPGGGVPPVIGPVAPPFNQTFSSFPNSNANRSVRQQLNVTTIDRNQLRVELLNESTLRAARLEGNDWGGGMDLAVDVYVKGLPGTTFSLRRLVEGQVTAVHGGGLGTTHAAGNGQIAVVNNGTGAQSFPVPSDATSTGVTSNQPHPTRVGYHLGATVSIGAYGFTYQGIDFCFPFGCPELLNFRSTSDLTMTITAECLSNVCPANGDESAWNAAGVQDRNNCYNYATNNRSGCTSGGYNNTASDPGGSRIPIFRNPDGTCAGLTCEILSARALADGLMGPFPDESSCPPGSCVVHLVLNPSSRLCFQGLIPRRKNCDYHWYRRNSDGSWSHKPGNTPARSFDPGMPPDFTTSCYPISCGYFCVPCDARIAPRGSCPLPLQSTVIGAIANRSGLENPSFPITDPADIQAIVSAIAAGVSVNAPSIQPGLEYAGLTVENGDGTPGLPDFVRFFDGVIYVYEAGGVRHLQDVAGGESIVRQLALDAGLGVEFCGCVADVDNGDGNGVCDGGVTIEDLLYYLASFADGRPRADVDDGTGTGTTDGGVTIDDLLYFLVRFSNGC